MRRPWLGRALHVPLLTESSREEASRSDRHAGEKYLNKTCSVGCAAFTASCCSIITRERIDLCDFRCAAPAVLAKDFRFHKDCQPWYFLEVKISTIWTKISIVILFQTTVWRSLWYLGLQSLVLPFRQNSYDRGDLNLDAAPLKQTRTALDPRKCLRRKFCP